MKPPFRTLRCTAVLALMSALPARALSNRPVVVELFTSQGCSSCPPADALLGELTSNDEIIALGFHVDYWDGIGWRDRYSLTEATERQRRYVDALHLSSAFTPQIVIDGQRSLVGSDKKAVFASIVEKKSPGVPINATVADDHLLISLPEFDDRHRHEVNLVAYVPQATTTISAGENSGRSLTEFNVVRQIRRLGTWDGTSCTFRVPLTSFPSDATRAAILIQQPEGGPIAGAMAVRLR